MERPDRFPPDDPREWLNRARSNLARARIATAEAYLEDCCVDAQQAAEKAIKAVMVVQPVAGAQLTEEIEGGQGEVGVRRPRRRRR